MELEASTIQSPGALAPNRIAIGPRLLRLRSDEQLVALLRSGQDEAFTALYDRYHKRLEGYARQMLPRGHDAEDVLQDVFVRAYRALRHDDRELAVKPWLFRIVHNCCIDAMRRNIPDPTEEVASLSSSPNDDPAAQLDHRETLRRLIEDIGRLPEQQRSALLLRELSGISYAEVAAVLDTTVPAVKSLLVRARMGLVRADAARDTDCSDIREQLTLAHDQGVRTAPTVRQHLRDCPACRSYRGQLCAVNKRIAALTPAGPLATLAKLIGLPGGSGGGAAALSTGGGASGFALGANHVAALVAAALASAGGGVALQHVLGSSGGGSGGAAIHRSHASPAHGPSASVTSTTSSELGGSASYQSGAGYGTGSGGSSSRTAGQNSAGTATNSAGSPGVSSASSSYKASHSPTPTTPPSWTTTPTGPPPITRPTSNATGPTPTYPSSGQSTGSGGSGSGTGDPTSTGSGSGSSGSGSSGSTVTGSGTGSGASNTGAPPTTRPTSDTTGPTPTASGSGQSTPSSGSGSGTSGTGS